jgi:hypothetical protein
MKQLRLNSFESFFFLSWWLRWFVEVHHLGSQLQRESAAEGAWTFCGGFRVKGARNFLSFTLHMFAERRCAMAIFMRAARDAVAVSLDMRLWLQTFTCIACYSHNSLSSPNYTFGFCLPSRPRAKP